MYIYIFNNDKKCIISQSTVDSAKTKSISLGSSLLDFINYDFNDYERLRQKICRFLLSHDQRLDDYDIDFSPDKTNILKESFPGIKQAYFEYSSQNWKEAIIGYLAEQYAAFYYITPFNNDDIFCGAGPGEALDYSKLQKELLEIIDKVFDYEYENQKYKELSPLHRMALLHDSFEAKFIERTVIFPSDYERYTKGSNAFSHDFWENDSDIQQLSSNYAQKENLRIDYIKDNFKLCSGYVFNSLRDSLLCEILKMAQAGITLRKCDNCGRYFIFNPNHPAKYCQYSYDNKRLSCQQIGSQRKYKQNLHPIRECYNKARNRRFNQMPSKKSGLRTADIENKYKLWRNENNQKTNEYIEKYNNASDVAIRNDILEEFRNYLDSTLNKE